LFGVIVRYDGDHIIFVGVPNNYYHAVEGMHNILTYYLKGENKPHKLLSTRGMSFGLSQKIWQPGIPQKLWLVRAWVRIPFAAIFADIPRVDKSL